jgi:hypothetical protein
MMAESLDENNVPSGGEGSLIDVQVSFWIIGVRIDGVGLIFVIG